MSKDLTLYLFVRFDRGTGPQALTKILNLANSPASKGNTPDAVGVAALLASNVDQFVATMIAGARPTTLSLTWRGLRYGFSLNKETLRSFPECFQQGMAARAELLGDIGKSAPEHWEGALGDRRVHALWILPVDSKKFKQEEERKELRRFVRAFNRGALPSVPAHGFEVLHIELGETPYDVDVNGKINDIEPRVEHFGFRDGISQPFTLNQTATNKIDLVATPPGGGRPRPDGSWAPVATGELFLGTRGKEEFRDEDGFGAVAPANAALRHGGTYLVYRKLEQDVAGFRAFLKSRRTSEEGRERLAAHMMGRWPNGSAVVDYPDRQGYDDGKKLNDFRYEAADPHGLRCPIGSHVRRANPRDFRDGEAARRHRIVRRGTAFGGSLLREGQAFDGEPRGLHFVALNAKIDQQFEFMQSEWMNTGELFGRAGLARCPITGTSAAAPGDAFAEGGRASADPHLPRFVTTRGGDYFFVPSPDALQKLAAGHDFPFETPGGGLELGEGSIRPTPAMVSEAKLEDYSKLIIDKKARTVRIGPLKSSTPSINVTFLGRYEDVAGAQQNSSDYGERNYAANSRRLWEQVGILGMPENSPERQEWSETLYRAYQVLAGGNIPGLHAKMVEFAAAACQQVLARVTPTGRTDLLQDLGFAIPYLFSAKFFGVAGPTWLTPVAVAGRFARANMMEVPKQWLERAPEAPASLWPYLTMQAWMRLSFLEVVVNTVGRVELTILARQAVRELGLHVDELIVRAQRRLAAGEPPGTLLAALVSLGPTDPIHLRRVRLIITDLTAPLIVNVGTPFARILDFCFDQLGCVPDFSGQNDQGLNAFIHEALRVYPAAPFQFRVFEKQTDLPTGGSGKATAFENDIAVMMVAAANRDPDAFPTPGEFRLDRDPGKYLTFGGPKDNGAAPNKGGWKDADGIWTSVHHCWGERIGLLLLREMLSAASKLPQLRRAPGKTGETVMETGLPYSLVAKFSEPPTGAPAPQPAVQAAKRTPKRQGGRRK